MRMLIALLALALVPSLVELSLGAGKRRRGRAAEQRYNVCLARCGANSQRCQRCRLQYKYCRYPVPYMGDLL